MALGTVVRHRLNPPPGSVLSGCRSLPICRIKKQAAGTTGEVSSPAANHNLTVGGRDAESQQK